MARLFDYTKGWTEVDPRGEITRTASEIVVTTGALALNTDHGYTYQQPPAGALHGDWDFTGEMSFDAGATSGFRVSPILVSDRVDGQLTIAAGAPDYWGFGCQMLNSGGTLVWQLYAYYPTSIGANEVAPSITGVSAGTTYYWRFRRDESVGTYGTLYLDVYTDAARTQLLGSQSLALKYQKFDFTYLYASNGFAAAANASGTARISNLRDMRGWPVFAPGTTTTRWTPRQRLLWNDGKHLCLYAANSVNLPQVAYLDPGTQEIGAAHDVPTMPSLSSPKAFDAFYAFATAYSDTLVFTSNASASAAKPIAKNDRDFTSYSQRPSGATVALTDPSDLIDDNEYAWVAGRNAAGDLVAYRATGPYGEASFSLLLTVEATAATNAAAQLVGYESGDVGLLCSIDGVLTYRHWTYATQSWGTEEAVTSGLGVYDNFRGVVSRNDTLLVQYRRTGATGLVGKRRSGGALGSEFTIAADIAGAATDYYHTSLADVGKADNAVVYYSDGTHLRYRVIADGTVGAAQTLIPDVRLANSGLTAPPFDGHRACVAYHHSSGMLFAGWVDLTPEQSYSGDGTVLGEAGWLNGGSLRVATDGAVSLVFQEHRGHYSFARMRNETTSEWMGDGVAFSRRYWDNHDTMVPFVDDAGKLYFFEGGRNHGDAARNTPLTLRRTPAALSTYANAAAVFAALQDVSPPTTGFFDVASGNRGYKQILVGTGADAGVIYYLFQHYEIATGTSRQFIAEYRGGAWSTPATLVEYLDQKPHIGSVYAFGYCGGGETTGQTSVHIVWQVRDETTSLTGGSLLCIEQSFAKIVPQGDGTFRAYRIDGVEMTLPMTLAPDRKDLLYSGRPASATLAPPSRANATAYAVNDVVNGGNGHLYRCKVDGTSGGSSPTWPTDHYATVQDGTVTWEEHGLCGTTYADTITANAISPSTGRFIAAGGLRNFVQGDGPSCTLAELRLWRWTGTAWTWSTIQNTAMPWRTSQSIAVSGSVVFVPYKQVVSGVEEIVLYSSSDETTWGMEQVTSGTPVTNGPPVISPRSSGTVTLSWFHWVHRNYGETVFKSLALAPVYFWTRARRGSGEWSGFSNRVKVRRA